MMDLEESSKKYVPNTNREEIWQIINKIHKENLEKVRQENVKFKNKRKREFSEFSIDEIIKKVVYETDTEKQNEQLTNESGAGKQKEKSTNDSGDEKQSEQLISDSGAAEYSQWKRTEYDTYNSVNRRAVVDSINILEKASNDKKKKNYTCTSSDYTKSSDTLWASAPYITKYIRSCIVRHDWKSLNYLLLFLLRYKSSYTCYIKQVTFLLSLMCSNQNPNIMLNLRQCFAKRNKDYRSKFDIWYISDD